MSEQQLPTSTRDRFRGALLGLACGDAVGTTVEFAPRGCLPPVVDMVGGGPFQLVAGQWTDDTSMAMCLAESLIERRGFDPRDQMSRYANWWQWGYWSSTGTCFDIGTTTASALQRFLGTGDPYAGATDAMSAGNGSLMRLAPVVLHAYPDRDLAVHLAGESSRTTHGASEAIESCQLFATLLLNALNGRDKSALQAARAWKGKEPAVARIASGAYLNKNRDSIRGTGYCIESLEAALWCFHTTDSFERAVLEAANLGDDADTTAAIVGQIAGAHYGASAMPSRWLEKLHLANEITSIADELWSGQRVGC